MTLVSDRLRFVFVHVPKSGGTSIKQELARHHDHPGLERGSETKHLTPDELRAGWPSVPLDEYFSFAFVRDPFEYLVSFWCHKTQNPTHPDHRAVADHETFGRWVDAIADRRSMWQSSYTHDADGEPVLDFVGRLESLEADYGQVAAKLGIAPTRLGHWNRSRHGAVADFYDIELAERVVAAFKRDFELLGFDTTPPRPR